MTMIKRAACGMAAVILTVQFAFAASAATPSYTAAYGTPAVDGSVKSEEYGPAQNLDKSTSSVFFAHLDMSDPNVLDTINFPNITYRFAWNEGHLYVGITAKNIEDIQTSKFQIDLSPEKKVRDKQKGVFFTFQVLSLDTGLVSVARDNYQTGGSTRGSMNITNKVQKAVKKTGDTTNIEVAIPLSELQVAGQGRDFSGITLKSGDWGVGTYFIGNGVGLTTTKGANNSALVSTNVDSGSLIEYYNPLTLKAKTAASTAGNTKTTKPGVTTSSGKTNSSAGGTTSTNESGTGTTDATGNQSTYHSDTDSDGSSTAATGDVTLTGASTTDQTSSNTAAGGNNGNNAGLMIGIVIACVVVIGGAGFAILKIKKII